MARDFVQFRIRGDEELIEAFQRFDRDTRRNLTLGIAHGGERVAERSRAIAAEKGLAPPGDSGRGQGGLVGGIRVEAKQLTVFIREEATRAGFPYPAIYEFTRGRARAFMEPAVREEAPHVRALAKTAVESAARTSGLA